MPITTIEELCDHFGGLFYDDPAETLASLNKAVYKGTSCGASISFFYNTGELVHGGSAEDATWADQESGLKYFYLSTIVEGSDAEFETCFMHLPVEESLIASELEILEKKASNAWTYDNIVRPWATALEQAVRKEGRADDQVSSGAIFVNVPEEDCEDAWVINVIHMDSMIEALVSDETENVGFYKIQDASALETAVLFVGQQKDYDTVEECALEIVRHLISLIPQEENQT